MFSRKKIVQVVLEGFYEREFEEYCITILQNCLLIEELTVLVELSTYKMINKSINCGYQLLCTLQTFENSYSVKAQCFQRVITCK